VASARYGLIDLYKADLLPWWWVFTARYELIAYIKQITFCPKMLIFFYFPARYIHSGPLKLCGSYPDLQCKPTYWNYSVKVSIWKQHNFSYIGVPLNSSAIQVGSWLCMYSVVKKSLCTPWLQHRKLQEMFKMSPTSLLTINDTILFSQKQFSVQYSH
jgi:hypothetical protein